MKKYVYLLVGFALFLQLIWVPAQEAAAQGGQPAPEYPAGTIRFVKPQTAGDCSDWRRSCDLRRALNDAGPGTEIWVSAGTYQPDFWADLGNFTFVAWVYWNGGSDWQRIFDFGKDTNSYMMLTPRASTGAMRFEIKKNGVSQVIDYPTALTTNVWNHVAVTFYGEAGTLYLNGVPQAGAITFDPKEVAGDNLWLGKSAYNQDPTLNGKIDEVAIFNRALSQVDIGTVMTSGWDSIPGKVLALHLDESTASNGANLPNSFENWTGGILRSDNGSDNKSTLGKIGNGVIFDGASDYIDLLPRRENTFRLKSGVALYGGFLGAETIRSQRNPSNNVTILSGDRLGDDGLSFANYGDNAYHVVTGSQADVTAILDGFTITGGSANGSKPNDRGGGMFNSGGAPTLAKITFSSNYAGYIGGGMYNYFSSPGLADVSFFANLADYGGGIANMSSSPSLTNAVFEGNYAHVGGGGIFNTSSNPTFTNTRFFANTATYGGGMCNHELSRPVLINVVFYGNQATYRGGGMYNRDSSPVLTNATLAGNYGRQGGAIYNLEASSPTLVNSIVWGNTADNADWSPGINGAAAITYSDIQGGWAGEGNINQDPLFLDSANRNYHLSSSSPAIDTGSNAAVPAGTVTDLDGNPRLVDFKKTGTATVDMGAYEAQPVSVVASIVPILALAAFLPVVKKMRRPNSTARFVVLVILVIAATFSLTTSSRACGVITHHHIAEGAIDTLDRLGYPELDALLRAYPGIITYGALFPDNPGTSPLTEYVHEHQFVEAYLDDIRPYFKSTDPEWRKAYALLLGIIAHNEADNPFHFGPNAFLWIAMAHEGQTNQALFEEDIDLYMRDAYEAWGPWGHYCNGWEIPVHSMESLLSILGPSGVTKLGLDSGFTVQNTLCVWESTEPRDVHAWMEANFLNWPDGGLLDMYNHIASVWQMTWDELSVITHKVYLPSIKR